jgi:hypothetical protein
MARAEAPQSRGRPREGSKIHQGVPYHLCRRERLKVPVPVIVRDWFRHWGTSSTSTGAKRLNRKGSRLPGWALRKPTTSASVRVTGRAGESPIWRVPMRGEDAAVAVSRVSLNGSIRFFIISSAPAYYYGGILSVCLIAPQVCPEYGVLCWNCYLQPANYFLVNALTALF